ncbi:MAG: polymorphic toxin-type HINT domain-containing protein, partial [Planctomycetaceae bacterium]
QDPCWIHLALPELGAVGPAEVLAIEPCPPLASGPGRTVTGTFAHAAADVLDLEIEGLDTPLGCTAKHRFWSADRHDFVPAGSLTIGEHLRTESGTLRQVTRITPRRGPPVAVFNLEVDAEHVYYVSSAGVLVHNAYPGGGLTKSGSAKPAWLQRLDEGNAFNKAQSPRYPHNEIYIDKPEIGFYRLDSYTPGTGEIVSRKLTQLDGIKKSSGLGYLNELVRKYAPGSKISKVPSNGILGGQRLRGRMILEVPVQEGLVPQTILDAANRLGIVIRDINGTVY